MRTTFGGLANAKALPSIEKATLIFISSPKAFPGILRGSRGLEVEAALLYKALLCDSRPAILPFAGIRRYLGICKTHRRGSFRRSTSLMNTTNHRGRAVVFVDAFAHAAAISGDLVEIPVRRIAGVRLRARRARQNHVFLESTLARTVNDSIEGSNERLKVFYSPRDTPIPDNTWSRCCKLKAEY